MSKFTFFFKVELFGPLLPKHGSVFSHYKYIGIFNNESVSWVEKPESAKANPSPNMTGVSLNVNKTIKNGSIIYFLIKSKDNSIRKVSKEVEIIIKHFSSLLSISVKNSRYYYKIISATIINPNNNTDVEGLPSDFLTTIAYKKRDIDDQRISFVEEIGELFLTDQIINKSIKYFDLALESEILMSKSNQSVLLYYFKIIELISNKVSKDNKLPKKEAEKQKKEVIDDFVCNYKISENNKKKIDKFKECESKIRILENNITKLKIIDASKILEINCLELVNEVISIRNRVVAHTNSDVMTTNETGEKFCELSKIFLLKYIIKYYGKGYLKSFNELDVQPFRKEDGYFYAPIFKSSYFLK